MAQVPGQEKIPTNEEESKEADPADESVVVATPPVFQAPRVTPLLSVPGPGYFGPVPFPIYHSAWGPFFFDPHFGYVDAIHRVRLPGPPPPITLVPFQPQPTPAPPWARPGPTAPPSMGPEPTGPEPEAPTPEEVYVAPEPGPDQEPDVDDATWALAEQARDALAEELRKEYRAARANRRKAVSPRPEPVIPGAVVGAVDIATGRVTAGQSGTRIGVRWCAEDHAVELLGALEAPGTVRFTSAVRPRNGKDVPVCRACGTNYESTQFREGTNFD